MCDCECVCVTACKYSDEKAWYGQRLLKCCGCGGDYTGKNQDQPETETGTKKGKSGNREMLMKGQDLASVWGVRSKLDGNEHEAGPERQSRDRVSVGQPVRTGAEVVSGLVTAAGGLCSCSDKSAAYVAEPVEHRGKVAQRAVEADHDRVAAELLAGRVEHG